MKKNSESIKPGYKMTPLGVIPEDWEVKKISDLAEVIMGQSPEGSTYNGSGIGTPLINGPSEFTEKHPIIVQWTTSPTKLCKNGDLLICVRGSSTGRLNIANDQYCIGRGVAAIRGRNFTDQSFLIHQISIVVAKLLTLTAGSTFPNIEGKALRTYEVCLPPSSEQKAIAKILSTWDEAIEKNQRLIEQKELRKKALMQQLLTGKKRLQGFKGEWEEVRLGDVLLENRILSPVPNPDKRIMVKLNLRGVEKRTVRGTEVDEGTQYYLRKANQFIYGKQNLHKGAFGIIPLDLDGFESSQDIPAFDLSESINPAFFIHFLSQENIYKSLENIASGTGSRRIQQKDLFKVSYLFPPKEEQTEIAILLSKAEFEISLQKQKLEQLKLQKKALMQVLLTGRKRTINLTIDITN